MGRIIITLGGRENKRDSSLKILLLYVKKKVAARTVAQEIIRQRQAPTRAGSLGADLKNIGVSDRQAHDARLGRKRQSVKGESATDARNVSSVLAGRSLPGWRVAEP